MYQTADGGKERRGDGKGTARVGGKKENDRNKYS
jgi:hypothetical protein